MYKHYWAGFIGLLAGVSVAVGQSLHHADVPQGKQYNPYRDSSILFGERAAAQVHETLFGWFAPEHAWNLSLNPFVGTDGILHGHNLIGESYELDTSLFQETHATNLPSGYHKGVWSGALSSVRGVIYSAGIWVSGPTEGMSIVPLIVQNEQQAAAEQHLLLSHVMHGPRTYKCALDAVATLQHGQNYINAQSCYRSTTRNLGGITAFCTIVGGISCWFTFGAGCIGGINCDLGVLVAYLSWQANFYDEWHRARSCLCLESQWRDANPGQDVPSSCGSFSCPEPLELPISFS